MNYTRKLLHYNENVSLKKLRLGMKENRAKNSQIKWHAVTALKN
jgi:hypothetical protein